MQQATVAGPRKPVLPLGSRVRLQSASLTESTLQASQRVVLLFGHDPTGRPDLLLVTGHEEWIGQHLEMLVVVWRYAEEFAEIPVAGRWTAMVAEHWAARLCAEAPAAEFEDVQFRWPHRAVREREALHMVEALPLPGHENWQAL